MPLASGTRTTPPPVQPVSPLDVPAAWWIDPAGTRWELTNWSGEEWFTMPGVKGIGAMPRTFTTDGRPRGGSSVRHIQREARLITWPLFVEGFDHADFLTNWRSLTAAFTSTDRLGPGTLVVARPDGSLRQIPAYYQSGWDNSGDDGTGILSDTAVLTLYCEDGAWRAATPTLITRAYAPAGTSFLSPYPNVSSSQTLGTTTVVNPGELEAWPAWTITGPASEIVATNNTTGQSWTLVPSDAGGSDLLVNESITVATDPPSVIGPDGTTSWIGGLNWPGAQLWPLAPGANDIDFNVTGSNTGTSISAQFFARYETA